MASNVAETLIGAVVLVVAGAFLLYANSIAGVGSGGSTYDLFAEFNNVEGVSVGTDVRLAGIKVGTVAGMELDPESYRAKVTFALQNDFKVPSDSEAAITSEGLLGGSYVSISPGASDFMLTDGEEIEMTQSAVSLINLLLKFASGGE